MYVAGECKILTALEKMFRLGKRFQSVFLILPGADKQARQYTWPLALPAVSQWAEFSQRKALHFPVNVLGRYLFPCVGSLALQVDWWWW